MIDRHDLYLAIKRRARAVQRRLGKQFHYSDSYTESQVNAINKCRSLREIVYWVNTNHYLAEMEHILLGVRYDRRLARRTFVQLPRK